MAACCGSVDWAESSKPNIVVARKVSFADSAQPATVPVFVAYPRAPQRLEHNPPHRRRNRATSEAPEEKRLPDRTQSVLQPVESQAKLEALQREPQHCGPNAISSVVDWHHGQWIDEEYRRHDRRQIETPDDRHEYPKWQMNGQRHEADRQAG